jgi:hypothetical protein
MLCKPKREVEKDDTFTGGLLPILNQLGRQKAVVLFEPMYDQYCQKSTNALIGSKLAILVIQGNV